MRPAEEQSMIRAEFHFNPIALFLFHRNNSSFSRRKYKFICQKLIPTLMDWPRRWRQRLVSVWSTVERVGRSVGWWWIRLLNIINQHTTKSPSRFCVVYDQIMGYSHFSASGAGILWWSVLLEISAVKCMDIRGTLTWMPLHGELVSSRYLT
jgi:hypothetical protein